MSDEDRIKELFARWVEHRVLVSSELSPEELCAETPELLEPLHERIRIYEGVEKALASPARDLARHKLAHYEIEEKLGEGGMGEVYAARDTKLGRRVALKVLPAWTESSREQLRRFEREARVMASLNHPHIATLHGFETEGRVHFLVMEHLEGETLADRLRKSALPITEVLRVGAQIAEAIEAAHREGVVHRDLKPGNVMLTKSGVKVLDFGLAKAIRPPPLPADSGSPTISQPLTRTGTIVGTLHYMAPEQLESKNADARSDIWSLGTVLYEMATGERPFQGESQASLIASIMKSEPPAVSERQPLSTPSFDHVVQRCLAKDPDARWQSASDVQRELEWIAAESPRSPAAGPSPHATPKPTIAVLPFSDLSPERDQEYYCAGLAEELVTALFEVEGLQVASTASTLQFRAELHDPQVMGRKLRVNTLLGGSVRKAGDRLRITTQLIKAEDGMVLATDRFDGSTADIFAFQEEIARSVVETLRLRFAEHLDTPEVERPTESLEAYNRCLQARHELNRRTADGMQASIDLFRSAIREDPAYALAHSGLAQVWYLLGIWGFAAPVEAMPRAKEAALRALELDGRISEARSTLASVRAAYDWDWNGAESDLRCALADSPRDAWTHHTFAGSILRPLLRLDEAIAEEREARRLDPANLTYQASLGNLYLDRGEHDRALEQLRAVVDIDPQHQLASFFLADVYRDLDRREEAFRVLQALGAGARGEVEYLARLGYSLARLGRRDEARSVLTEIRDLGRGGYVSPMSTAFVHLALEEREAALSDLERGVAERSPHMTWIGVNRVWDPLREEPRFQKLVEEIGLDSADPARRAPA